jgi:ectoine hydroxylase-related dioxygenase (phytanoyl-CoA dioxygenase family)
MEAGDLLCFTSLTPHHAYTNESNAARFSLDIRYEATEAVDPDGEGRGFVVRSLADPSTEESCEAWMAKGWEGRAY